MQVSSLPMKPIQDWGCQCGRSTEMIQCGASCSSQRMLVHRDTPHPPPGYLCWHLGSHMGNKDAPSAGPQWKVKQSGDLRPNLNSPHVLPSACRRKERASDVISITFLCLCHTCRIWGVLNKCFAGKQRIEQLIIDVNHHYTFIKGNLEENYNCQYLPFSEYFSKTVCILNYTCAKGLN